MSSSSGKPQLRKTKRDKKKETRKRYGKYTSRFIRRRQEQQRSIFKNTRRRVMNERNEGCRGVESK